MEFINLLAKSNKTMSERKALMKNILFIFSFVCLAFSITSAYFFVQAILLPFQLPMFLVGILGIGTGILIDLLQGQAVLQLSLDYYKDKKLEPYTLGIAIAFIFLSAYTSISGTETRSKAKQLSLVQTDSTGKDLAAVVAASSIPLNEVVKTKDMSWTEHKREVESAKLKQVQADLQKEQVKAAAVLHNERAKNRDKEMRLTIDLFSASKWTLLAIQLVYLVCMFGVGYYQSVIQSESVAPSFSREPSFLESSQDLDLEIGSRTQIRHLGNYLHNDCVMSETQVTESNTQGYGVCLNCGQSFLSRHPRQKFCSNKGSGNCKDMFNNKNR